MGCLTLETAVENVIIGFFALPFLFLPAQVMTGRESTRDIRMQSTGMNEDINLLG